ncbi:glutamine--fructose-6-phosphate transaminase (isomerizing) [Candidatus Neptunochlamydia vexilliferae]|nr:glutamine--fructose-6-phosphate transaminase (isomerizing) [Candidatus Neptunochlamydia vexilliferae]
MCGIFGYIRSPKELRSSVDVCIDGLKLLEYRGYDSSGIAGMIDGKIRACKRAGKVGALEEAVTEENLELESAIAHTRWATHGIPNQENAHPHLDQEETLAIVHNGIIENHHAIREKLIQKGVQFSSDTDTEVIAALISHYYQGNLRTAVQKALRELHGSFALAIIHKDHPNEIIGASRESPLVVGMDPKTGEAYLSSDANSFNGKVLDVLYLKDDEVVLLKHNSFTLYNTHGRKVEKKLTTVAFENTSVSKNGYDHYMLKEIFEQPQTVQQAMAGRLCEEFGKAELEGLKLSDQKLQSVNRILILACGSSWHAGSIAASQFEHLARIPTEVEIASEFRYTNPIISEDTLVIAISQSGETADTIAAVREAKAKGAKVVALCNVDHSTLVRETDSFLFLRAGPEVSVCSTKAFTSQLTVLSLLCLHMARLRHLSEEEGQQFIKELKHLPHKITQVLAQGSQIEAYAEKYASFEHFFFMGRRYMYPTSLEAALKLKEISYLNANGYPAGEMKHGPIALVNPDLAVIGLCGNLQTFDKMMSNLMEIKARGGSILAFAPKGKEEVLTITNDVLWIPKVIDPLASIPYSVAGQLFAYYVAKIQGTDIDQPRNLAKSVTVE